MRAARLDERSAEARALMLNGLDALHHGRLDRAEQCLVAASERSPTDSRIRGHLANTLWQQGRLDCAIEQLEQAAAHCGDPLLHVQLGEAYLASGRWGDAAEQARRALQLTRQSGPAWALLGKSQAAQGDSEAALASWHRALACDDQLDEVALLMARAYLGNDRPQRALATTEALLQRWPAGKEPVEVILVESQALMALDLPQQAIRRLTAATTRGHAPPEVFALLASAQLQQGQLLEARETIARGHQVHGPHRALDELQPLLTAAIGESTSWIR